MQKKILSLALTLTLVLTLIQVPTIPVYGNVASANKIGQTQVCDWAVFIDEQPVFTYLYKGTNYIPVINLDKYGFDVIEEGNTLTLKRNTDKNVELAPKSLINKKKNDKLFLNTYPVSQGKQKVLLDGEQIISLNIEGKECIETSSLSNYAAISWDKDSKIEKLDYKKKEFEIKQKEIKSEIIEYTDAESAGYEDRISRLLLGRYTGEVSENMKNGFGVFEFNYIDNGNNGKIDSVTNGYWKNNLANGFQIYQGWEENNTWGWFYDFDKKYKSTPKNIQQYNLIRANYKDDKVSDGAFLRVNIRYDALNKDRSKRQEGMYRDGDYDGLYRISKIDDSYKYRYRVVSETMWDKGDIALTKEEILAKFNEIQPPLNKDELKKIDTNIRSDLPATLEECYKALEKALDPKNIKILKSGTEDDLWEYHLGLGMWMRNQWLWSGQSGVYKYFVLNGVTHPDDMSGIIIEGFYNYLKGTDFDIEEAFYHNKKSTVISYLLNIDEDEGEDE